MAEGWVVARVAARVAAAPEVAGVAAERAAARAVAARAATGAVGLVEGWAKVAGLEAAGSEGGRARRMSRRPAWPPNQN